LNVFVQREVVVRATLTQMNYVPVLQRQCVNYLGHSVQEILDQRERVSGKEKHSGKKRKYAVLVRMLPPRMKTHYGQIYTQFL